MLALEVSMETTNPLSEPPARSAAGARTLRRRALRAAAAALGLAATVCVAPSAYAAAPATRFALPTPVSVLDWFMKGPDGQGWFATAAPEPSRRDAAEQVLALINQARARERLPAYTISPHLTRSAAAHNQTMAAGCGLSHQCLGEPALGARETAAEVHWASAGENIGEGGPVADSDAAVAGMAAALTRSMLEETPPDDGHRRNILSTSFHHVGIAVSRDGAGTVWMTQDFSD
jgi:uncharacterized protein YkwD